MANGLRSGSPRGRLKPKKTAFDAQLFLQSVGASRRVEEFRKKQAIFSQGEPADSVMYVQKGSVKLTVVNESGKEAVVAIFGPGTSWEKGAWQARHFAWGRPQQFHRQPYC
jgi:CRP-like cAMP-binding protein